MSITLIIVLALIWWLVGILSVTLMIKYDFGKVMSSDLDSIVLLGMAGLFITIFFILRLIISWITRGKEDRRIW